ncbi:MAG: alpha/beta hydrolase [Actinobacteria bacterium]|nr:alpha/beta hydrolase [Actinomycetota bacterium]
MGAILLFVAFAVETALAAFRIVTKSNQPRVRAVLRAAALAGFVVLALLSVVRWDLRWYGLTLLLVVWGVLGVVEWVRRRGGSKVFRVRNVVLGAVFSFFLFFLGLAPALVFPEHAVLDATGEFRVATVTQTYSDPGRTETYTKSGGQRRLSVDLWYPLEAEGTYPLVVFSHGTTATKSSNTSFYNELASHGYVVAAVDHAYEALYTTFDDGQTAVIDPGYVKQFSTENAHTDRQQSYTFYQQWMQIRMGDLSFVIDTILAKAKAQDADGVYRLVDAEKIGVAGHSLGGSAALGMGRLRTDVDAVISLEAPFMYDIQGTKDGEFVWNQTLYPTPVLNVYTQSWSHLGEWKQYAKNFALLPETSETAFNVYISGANHLSLTDLALLSPFLTTVLSGSQSTKDAETCLRIVNKVSLEFFDSYLKGKGAFKASGTY